MRTGVNPSRLSRLLCRPLTAAAAGQTGVSEAEQVGTRGPTCVSTLSLNVAPGRGL